MGNKVVVDRLVLVHNNAQCCDCNKDWDVFTFPESINYIRQHVLKTGHTVNRETGYSGYYKRESSDA